jgi:hypothetical protein
MRERNTVDVRNVEVKTKCLWCEGMKHEERAFGTWKYIFEFLWCDGTKHDGRQKCGGENRVLVVRGIVVRGKKCGGENRVLMVRGIVVRGNETRWAPEMLGRKPSP